MIGSKLSLIRRVLIASGVMTCVMLIAFIGLAAMAWSQFELKGLIAAAVACGVCWVSGLVALGTALLFRDPRQAAQGMLFGMLFRMGLPLAVGLGLTQSRSELLQVGVMGMLVIVYLIGLFVETLLALWIVESSTGAVSPGMVKAS